MLDRRNESTITQQLIFCQYLLTRQFYAPNLLEQMRRKANIILILWGSFSLLVVLFTFSVGMSLEKRHRAIIDLAERTKNEFFLAQKLKEQFFLSGDTMSVLLLIDHLKIAAQNFDSIIDYTGKEVAEADPRSPEGFIIHIPYMKAYLREIELFFGRSASVTDAKTRRRLNEIFAGNDMRFKEFESGLQKYLLRENRDFKLISFFFKLGAFIALMISLVYISKLINRLRMTELRLVEQTVETEQRERSRIAADLHDDLGGILSCINLYLKILEAEFREGKDVSQQITNLRQLSDTSLQRVEAVINNLAPLSLTKYGLEEAVHRMCGRMSKLGKCRFEFDARQFSHKLSPGTELILFRIFSELTNNALKHSRASLVQMVLKSSKHVVKLAYHDDGIGLGTNPVQDSGKNKIGLKSIKNRIESLRGTCQIKTAPGKGLDIRLQFRITKQRVKKTSRTAEENGKDFSNHC